MSRVGTVLCLASFGSGFSGAGRLRGGGAGAGAGAVVRAPVLVEDAYRTERDGQARESEELHGR